LKLEEISRINDKVGDVHILSQSLDYDTRDACFIDDGENLIFSEDGQWHSEILDKIESEIFGSGDIYDGCAFIDIYERMDKKKVLEDLIKADRFKKIYYYDFVGGTITRCR
jgi:hypothetical protein